MSTVNWDSSIRSFIGQAASSSPTPGGGSVAALAAALGAAMASMVGNLSQGEKFASIQPAVTAVIETMERLSAECETLLAADIASFNGYMEALKLPRSTEEEKAQRRHALHEATTQAIDVPLRLIGLCKEGLASACGIAETANRNVISDLGIGAILFEAAAESAMLTVDINLASLKDPELKLHYAERSAAWMEEIRRLKGQALQTTRRRIAE